MREVLWNLALNAIQAMHEGGTLSVETKKVFDQSSKAILEMRIMDNGHGIDSQYLEKIFEPFYTTKERGTGLGLAIVNRIVENYAGHIMVESTPGHGTTVIVRLPIVES